MTRLHGWFSQRSFVGRILKIYDIGSLMLRWCILLSLGLSACNLVDPGACTTEAVPTMVVEVRDAETGAPAAAGAHGYAEEAAFKADLIGPDAGADALHLYGPFERAGTYRVTVMKAGYVTWQQEGVQVSRDECHVRTVHLRADLQPS